MRHVDDAKAAVTRRGVLRVASGVSAALAAPVLLAQKQSDKPLYLTFDTGHMEVAPFIAETLRKHGVLVTFFGAHERTREGDGSLGEHWAPWWKARAAEGHEFASHTYSHAYWRDDLAPEQPGGPQRFRIRPSAGPLADQNLVWTAQQYCEDIARASRRMQQMTGRKTLPLFRAPGGKTSPKLLAAAQAGGFKHVSWAPAGFLGDELPSDTYPNNVLLKKALRDIRGGDILLAHLGIWSRKDVWATGVLDPLLSGLKERGFGFRTIREHPDYQQWLKEHS